MSADYIDFCLGMHLLEVMLEICRCPMLAAGYLQQASSGAVSFREQDPTQPLKSSDQSSLAKWYFPEIAEVRLVLDALGDTTLQALWRGRGVLYLSACARAGNFTFSLLL
jgi:hypothetical protein